MRRMTGLRAASLALPLAAALALAACSGGETVPAAGPAASAAPPGGPLDLTGACPATVVMQQDWQPEAEHGGMYSLVGPDRVIDTDAKHVRGSLVAQGVDTGVDIEIRPGGPNVGFQPVPAVMALDDSIVLGTVNSDAAIAAAAGQPTVAVVSQLTTSPLMLMWDPASHPGAQTLRDVAASGVPVLTSDPVITALLVEQGIITSAQVDTSYEGTPARFVSEPRILQQGFATAEPYLYEREIREWGRPVGYQKLADLGYSVYPSPPSVRADRLEQLRPCLQKLVPIMQRAQIDYLTEPGPTNALIVELTEAYQTGWTYSSGVADYAVRTMREQGLVTDDPASGVFGQFDPARMQQVADTFGSILRSQGTITDVPDAAGLYTNEFIDPGIRMG
ncbi:ABC transporter substrate-binding protein [Pseudonocardia sp. DSM 110487]|uniref:ABC transporter substrate-binding protein n=1 Tax=Pseudonocardia sp. DSM 110487 TaxID=2865833 RepID=UPI001C699210|nr:ABC transporter substrate-binding protein [Pseudonocardia sp. DSM 110487]QYN34349.1 ABC transporter substrate-binding protein [Pseudonocardia sp. DSM 110487]